MTLKIDEVSVKYGKRTALHRTSLEVRRGEVLGLLGPNGSGKSSLIKAITRIVRPATGKIFWDGSVELTALHQRELARLVAYVPQSIDTSFALTVRESVLLGRTPYFGIRPRREDWAHVDHAIGLLGLEELAERNASELSGGQAQRVLIARAIAQDPSILLLDEPTSALDIRYQLQTLALASQVAAQRDIAVIVSLHDLNQAARYSDKVAFLHNGILRAHDRPAAAYRPALISEIYEVHADVTIQNGIPEVRPALVTEVRAGQPSQAGAGLAAQETVA